MQEFSLEDHLWQGGTTYGTEDGLGDHLWQPYLVWGTIQSNKTAVDGLGD